MKYWGITSSLSRDPKMGPANPPIRPGPIFLFRQPPKRRMVSLDSYDADLRFSGSGLARLELLRPGRSSSVSPILTRSDFSTPATTAYETYWVLFFSFPATSIWWYIVKLFTEQGESMIWSCGHREPNQLQISSWSSYKTCWACWDVHVFFHAWSYTLISFMNLPTLIVWTLIYVE